MARDKRETILDILTLLVNHRFLETNIKRYPLNLKLFPVNQKVKEGGRKLRLFMSIISFIFPFSAFFNYFSLEIKLKYGIFSIGTFWH